MTQHANKLPSALLAAVALLAPMAMLPVYFSTLIGWGLSPGGAPAASVVWAACLAIVPTCGLIAGVWALFGGKAGIGAIICIICGGLVAIAELLFCFGLANSG